MFDKSVHNVTGAIPFNPRKFPVLIGLGEEFQSTQLCEKPADIPRGVDFLILGTNICTLTQKEELNAT